MLKHLRTEFQWYIRHALWTRSQSRITVKKPGVLEKYGCWSRIPNAESANRESTNQSQFQLSIVVTLFHCSRYRITSAVNTQGISNKGRVQLASCNAQVQASRFCSLLFYNKTVTSKSATINLCVEAIHAVDTVLWHPGEQTHILQTNKQRNQRTTIPVATHARLG